MADIKFFALGGQDERGKNLFCVEINKEIYVFDCGIKYPEKSVLGIDMVTPNFTYLKDNSPRVKGVFISNPSIYNAGGVGYFLKDLPNVPIYCSEVAVEVLKERMMKSKIRYNDSSFKVIKHKDIIKFKETSVHIFRVTASFPNTFGFSLPTENGTIIYMGDYMIQANNEASFEADTLWARDQIKSEVLAFIGDSEYANRMDFTTPNHKIERFISSHMKNLKKRLVIGIFEEDVYKMYEIIRLAKESGRKVAIYGKTLLKIIQNKTVQEELDLKPSDIIKTSEVSKYPDCVIIINGTGDILYSRLDKMANDGDESITFDENDTIILAVAPMPGVEKRHAQTLDELARTNAELISLSDKAIWSMRASYEDIKLMVNIFKPKYFIPVKGLYKNFLCAEKAAIEAGIFSKNVMILKNGQTLKLSKDRLVYENEKIKVNDVYVNVVGVGDVSSIVLNERKQLSTNGILVVGVNVDSKTKEIASLIDIQMRGLVYIFEDSPIFKIMQKQVIDIIAKHTELFKKTPKEYDQENLKKEINLKIGQIVKTETGKKPIILVVINELEEDRYYLDGKR
ncbi:ribonuclease J [Spiroplasma endosymbiont of Crioceris asparagi]|uniref:ribonuclease J n=1 Tax=Spiroplasma endosymbiont of Crioceris asparagi TaxID=3066286 RepID=UPI0030CA984E